MKDRSSCVCCALFLMMSITGCSLLGASETPSAEPVAVEVTAEPSNTPRTAGGVAPTLAPRRGTKPLTLDRDDVDDRDGLDEFTTILPSAQRSPEGPCYPTPTGSVVVDVDWRGGYELFTKYGDSADDVGLHVFSIYEVRDDHRAGRHPEGEATIKVEFPGEHDLVLSSYEPVHWQVSTGEDTSLRHITVYGYHTQRVSAPEGVKVDIYSDEGGTGAGVYCGYSIPYDGGGCDTDKLLDQIEDDAGRPVSSFHGTYRATTFELRDTLCPFE